MIREEPLDLAFRPLRRSPTVLDRFTRLAYTPDNSRYVAMDGVQ